MKHLILSVIVLSFLLNPLCSHGKELKVLTIGNSFADSVFKYLPSIVGASDDSQLVLKRANLGGCSLQRHWNNVEKSQTDPQYAPYSGKTLKQWLTAEKWDVVTIQQASHESWKPDSYQPYAENLIKFVRENAPQAEIIVQQTWSYNISDKRIGGDNPSWGFDQTGMYERLTANYRKLAADNGFRIIPSGQAVQNARAAIGTITPENDVVGAGKDTIHLNDKGQYLQACVWFMFLFDKTATDIKFQPKSIDAETTALLQTAAEKAVKEFPQTKSKTDAGNILTIGFSHATIK